MITIIIVIIIREKEREVQTFLFCFEREMEDEFPVAALLPKDSTVALRFLKEHPTFDGRGVVIAVFDTVKKKKRKVGDKGIT